MSVVVYGAPIWFNAINISYERIEVGGNIQRKAVLWCISVNSTLSMEKIFVLAGIPVVKLIPEERMNVNESLKKAQRQEKNVDNFLIKVRRCIHDFLISRM